MGTGLMNNYHHKVSYFVEDTYAWGTYMLPAGEEAASLGQDVELKITTKIKQTRHRFPGSRIKGPQSTNSKSYISYNMEIHKFQISIKKIIHLGLISFGLGNTTHTGSGPFDHNIKTSEQVGVDYPTKSITIMANRRLVDNSAVQNDLLVGAIITKTTLTIDFNASTVQFGCVGYGARFYTAIAGLGYPEADYDDHAYVAPGLTTLDLRLVRTAGDLILPIVATKIVLETELKSEGILHNPYHISKIAVGELILTWSIDFYLDIDNMTDYEEFIQYLKRGSPNISQDEHMELSIVLMNGLSNPTYIVLDYMNLDEGAAGPTFGAAGSSHYKMKGTCGTMNLSERNNQNHIKNGKLIIYNM